MKTNPTNIPQLLSTARCGFLRSGHDAPEMKELSALFGSIAKHAYMSHFLWSDYNKTEWEKFVTLDNSRKGACAFSAETDGECPQDKGFGVGGPTGPQPYHVWDLTGHTGAERIREAVRSTGKYTLELIG